MDYPRVTDILKPFSGSSYVPKDILGPAAVRGTVVHAICAEIAKGGWVPDGMIDEEYRGYVNSFKLWLEKHIRKPIIIEKRFVHTYFKYTGQVDMVAEGVDDNLYLIDLKTTSAPQRSHVPQMAAYKWLILHAQKIDIHAALIVYLDKDGAFPKIRKHEHLTHEFDVFLSALECYNYFHPGKKRGPKEIASD
jgi:PD-(D/E)XK nuclease superfamily